ncbi:hypothetical protein BOH66_04220 [Microbacterium aurum]|uniref:Uncharacterized protein n=1 Tax=Microbacterium aurum TaxID=36805 RepID=A0A1P8U620_9MICO|nr:hypothetical protein BOH66_04220 [Microbacterium aurum]
MALCDAGVHEEVPFYGQVEPELRLHAKGAAVSPDLGRADAVDRAECSTERLARAIGVPHRDAEQVRAASDENTRRTWYSVVPSARASDATSRSSYYRGPMTSGPAVGGEAQR